jgi:hypothetical protein
MPDQFYILTPCVQASRNRLKSLPATLANLRSLELMRVAVNQLKSLPESLHSAPKLAWVSLSGNPLCPDPHPPTHQIADITAADLRTSVKLGDGASGEVFEADWQGRHCAIKQFSADDASPDGQASDEIAVQLFVEHPALTLVVARVREPPALVMELVDGQPMAEKPNFESLLRCRWSAGLELSLSCACAPTARCSAALQSEPGERLSQCATIRQSWPGLWQGGSAGGCPIPNRHETAVPRFPDVQNSTANNSPATFPIPTSYENAARVHIV